MKHRIYYLLTLILTLSLSRSGLAQDVPAPPRYNIPDAGVKPSILQNVGIDQNLGALVPGDLVFNDETGQPVHLRDFYHKRPIILTLVYFDCPMLCTMVLNDLVRTMRAMPENAGKDFDILTVSFNPADDSKLASAKKKTYLAQYDREGADSAWHFLTGSQASISALTSAVGFRYVWDPQYKQFAHASGIIILTPEGKVSKYFYGIDYVPKDLRLALVEASGNQVGGAEDQFLLYCFHYDPATGKYGLAINRLLHAGGVLTVAVIGTFLCVMFRRDRTIPSQPVDEKKK